MLTRSKAAKMTSQMTEETSEVRARGQESQQQQEEVTLRSLMDFMSEMFDEQNNYFKNLNERFEEFDKNLDEHFAKQKEMFDTHFAKQKENFIEFRKEFNKDLDEHFNKQNEQFALLRTCLLYTSSL